MNNYWLKGRGFIYWAAEQGRRACNLFIRSSLELKYICTQFGHLKELDHEAFTIAISHSLFLASRSLASTSDRSFFTASQEAFWFIFICFKLNLQNLHTFCFSRSCRSRDNLKAEHHSREIKTEMLYDAVHSIMMSRMATCIGSVNRKFSFCSIVIFNLGPCFDLHLLLQFYVQIFNRRSIIFDLSDHWWYITSISNLLRLVSLSFQLNFFCQRIITRIFSPRLYFWCNWSER